MLFKKLDIYILKQFLLLFFATFFICLFVLMMQFVWKYVDELIGKGLSLFVLAKFFWYMAQMLVPQALPLSILLSTLITMGNMGENMELTAVKAAGISLLKMLRGMIVVAFLIGGCSFIFQNKIGPEAQEKLSNLMMAMRQKSPEVEIPEGIFYNGVPGCNLYVKKKDMDTGMLYGMMIYRMTNSFDDAAIVLADSGKLQTTADDKHLKLTLYSGEWFENLRSQEMGNNVNVPYRRETFAEKVILLDFDNELKDGEDSHVSAVNRAKSIADISLALDTLHMYIDSIGQDMQGQIERMSMPTPQMTKRDSLSLVKLGKEGKINFDTLYAKLSPEKQRMVLEMANGNVQRTEMSLMFSSELTSNLNQAERESRLEMVNKFTLSFMCIVLFFIGASLGAIIRKGGLGVPVIVATLVYILFFVLDNLGFRMARQGDWSVGVRKSLALAVLVPLAVFVTYKANKDSVVFNMDAYRNFFMHLLGMRFKRHIASKEVIIEEPRYYDDAQKLHRITDEVRAYSHSHSLKRLPDPRKVFFYYQPDHDVEHIVEELESVIEDLGNTRDRYILSYINRYPVVSEKAHTRPFDYKWMNVASAIIFPVGIVLYIRMCRFRLRLYRDMKQIRRTNDLIEKRIADIL